MHRVSDYNFQQKRGKGVSQEKYAWQADINGILTTITNAANEPVCLKNWYIPSKNIPILYYLFLRYFPVQLPLEQNLEKSEN